MTTAFLVRINALFVAMALVAGAMGFMPYGVAVWLVVASIAAANGAFHIWATVRRRRYSPGVITGSVAFLPLAAFGFLYFWQQGLAGSGILVQAALIGPAYNVYAAWNHRRRAKSMAASGG